MGFKEVQDLDAENTTALGGFNKKSGKPNPTSATGYFLGSKEVNSPKSKTGKASIHILQTPKGNLGVWGKTDLDRKMKAVEAGCLIRITQSGTVSTPNGDMYKFKVEVDKDDRIEVNIGGNESSTADSEETGYSAAPSYSEEPEETDLDAEETQPDEIAPPRAQAPRSPAKAVDPARAAKVAAALGRRA